MPKIRTILDCWQLRESAFINAAARNVTDIDVQLGEKSPDMSAVIMEAQLVKAITADAALGRLRVTATVSPGKGVAVSVGGSLAGVWRWRNGVFAYTPKEAARAEVTADSLAEAVYETRERLK